MREKIKIKGGLGYILYIYWQTHTAKMAHAILQ